MTIIQHPESMEQVLFSVFVNFCRSIRIQNADLLFLHVERRGCYLTYFPVLSVRKWHYLNSLQQHSSNSQDIITLHSSLFTLSGYQSAQSVEQFQLNAVAFCIHTFLFQRLFLVHHQSQRCSSPQSPTHHISILIPIYFRGECNFGFGDKRQFLGHPGLAGSPSGIVGCSKTCSTRLEHYRDGMWPRIAKPDRRVSGV